MTEPNDPFADQPYVPPAQRDEEQQPSAQPESPAAEPSWPPPAQSAADAPAPQEPGAQPVGQSTPEAPAPPAYSQPTYSQQPVEPTVQQPTYQQPVEPTVGQPTYQASYNPAADQPTYQQPGYEQPGYEQPAGAPTWSQPLAQEAPPAAKPRRGGGKLVGGLAALILVAGGAGAGGAAIYNGLKGDSGGSTGTTSLGSKDNSSSASLPTTAIEKVAAKMLPATVQINFASSSNSSTAAEGLGTGIIISSDGDILTNNHVVEDAANGGTLVVTFNDGSSASATIVGRDSATDIAVIKAKGKSGLPTASIGNSKSLVVGQPVVAIGSPYGLESTVTSGIVSALNRPVSPASESTSTQTATAFPAIQTDAAINPGNSGGPLVNLDGQVIGINSAIKSSSDSSGSASGSIGLGFAIPINLASNVAKQILAGKTVEHARIGVSVQDSTSNGGLTTNGAKIQKVDSGSAGAKAGLKTGDIVTAVDGHPVADGTALVATVRGYQPGDKVALTILRGGKTQKVEVTLGSDGGSLSK